MSWSKYIASITSVVTMVFCLVACSPQPARSVLTVPSDTLPSRWEPLLQQQGVIKMKTLNTGEVYVPAGKMLNLERPGANALRAETGETEQILELQVFAHWIKHPQRGDFLIDSGFDESFTHRSRGNITGLLVSTFMSDTAQRRGRDTRSQVDAAGANIQGVFFTHLHGDHTAGVAGLPFVKQFVIGKGEKYHDVPLIFSGKHLAEVETLLEIDFDNAKEMPILGKTVDIWGDHSLLAIDTRGHSEGHVSYLVNTEQGWVLLTGDASHTRWGFEHGIEPGLADDREATRKSFEKLVAFAKKYPQVTVIMGHEL